MNVTSLVRGDSPATDLESISEARHYGALGEVSRLAAVGRPLRSRE